MMLFGRMTVGRLAARMGLVGEVRIDANRDGVLVTGPNGRTRFVPFLSILFYRQRVKHGTLGRKKRVRRNRLSAAELAFWRGFQDGQKFAEAR